MSKVEKEFRSYIKTKIEEMEKNLGRKDFSGHNNASSYRVGKLDGYRNAIDDIKESLVY